MMKMLTLALVALFAGADALRVGAGVAQPSTIRAVSPIMKGEQQFIGARVVAAMGLMAWCLDSVRLCVHFPERCRFACNSACALAPPPKHQLSIACCAQGPAGSPLMQENFSDMEISPVQIAVTVTGLGAFVAVASVLLHVFKCQTHSSLLTLAMPELQAMQACHLFDLDLHWPLPLSDDTVSATVGGSQNRASTACPKAQARYSALKYYAYGLVQWLHGNEGPRGTGKIDKFVYNQVRGDLYAKTAEMALVYRRVKENLFGIIKEAQKCYAGPILR
eukprot:6212364-Pleurochrysis_carterae.AAC.1